VILALQWDWIDLKTGVMKRRGHGETEKRNKRRPPVRLGKRILGFLRRWRDMGGGGQVVGLSQRQLRTAFEMARKGSGLTDIHPHTLRHTRATWLMQARVSPWEAAGHLGMNVQTLINVYGHHHPDFQKDAADV